MTLVFLKVVNPQGVLLVNKGIQHEPNQLVPSGQTFWQSLIRHQCQCFIINQQTQWILNW